ncbi:MAG: alpha/beta hydrolase [Flavobacteriales bacterium]|nr:alpha/beta hydrolase [Flavobacteriales bacterium]
MHRTIDVSGKGPTLVFVHGNSMSAKAWQLLLEQPQIRDRAHIALDLPGHGSASPYPTERSYGIDPFATDLTALLSAFPDAVIIGHSLGGHVALRSLETAAGVRGVLVFGSPPLKGVAQMAEAFHPAPAMGNAFKAELTDEEVDALATAYLWPESPFLDLAAADIRRTDPRFRSDLAASVGTGIMPDEQGIIRGSGVPVCMVQAEKDPFVRMDFLEAIASGLFWKDKVHLVPGTGHSPHLQQPEALAHLIDDFLEAI